MAMFEGRLMMTTSRLNAPTHKYANLTAEGLVQHLAKDAIAFAIHYGDNCNIPHGYAERNGYDDVDWLSDWGAFLADHVFDELHRRGFQIIRPTLVMKD